MWQLSSAPFINIRYPCLSPSSDSITANIKPIFHRLNNHYLISSSSLPIYGKLQKTTANTSLKLNNFSRLDPRLSWQPSHMLHNTVDIQLTLLFFVIRITPATTARHQVRTATTECGRTRRLDPRCCKPLPPDNPSQRTRVPASVP